MVTRARKTHLLVVGVAALLSVVLGSLPDASAQQQAAEQFVCNDRFSIQVTADGRLNFGAFPNPSPDCRAGGSSYPLSTTWPFSPTSYTTVKIDGEFHRFELGTQSIPPTIVRDQSGEPIGVFTSANFGEVEVSQLVSIAQNPATGGQQDAARISYTIENVSPNQATHDVGIRLFIDTRVGNSENPTFFVEGRAVTTETDYGVNAPDVFTVQNPTVSSQAAAGAMGEQFGNVRPGRFIIGSSAGLAESPWNYQASGQQINDSAFAAYWETFQVPPGSTTTYFMTYGLGTGGQGGGGGGGGDPIPGCEETEQRQCGTTGDDNISSSDGQVVGGGGDDNITLTVNSGTQSLTVDGGAGADQIFLNIEDPSSGASININSGEGSDRIFIPKQPGDLRPVIKTGGGNDVMNILPSAVSRKVSSLQTSFIGRYLVNGGGGTDRFTLGLSHDVINGAGGNDRINGAAGNDEVEGGAGDDDIQGGAGGDVLHGGDGANDFAGGPGRDTCLSDTRKDQFSGCERIRRNHRRNHQQL